MDIIKEIERNRDTRLEEEIKELKNEIKDLKALQQKTPEVKKPQP